MAKYYIQSGKVTFVVCACDVEGAALWTMHRVMDRKVCEFENSLLADDIDPFDLPVSDAELEEFPQAIPYDAMLDGLAEFGEKILVSQIGFGRDDAGELETELIFHQWRQLMKAVDRIHDQLG